MPNRGTQLRLLLGAAGLFVLLHWLCMFLFRTHAQGVSYPFIIVAPLLAFAGCSRQLRSGPQGVRISWTLLSGSFLLWSAGMTIEAWELFTGHVAPEIASVSDFFLCIYGIPILLAISTPTGRARSPLFIWLDSIQAVTTAYLIYLAFFSVSPFTVKPLQPIGVNRLVLIYTVESLLLAGGASLRCLPQRHKGASFHFYRLLASYLWIYVVCIGFLNYGYLYTGGNTGYLDLFIDIPFLFLWVAATLQKPVLEEETLRFDRRRFVLFADTISPVLFTLALFALCFAVMPVHLYGGILSLVIAFSIYFIRATALQSQLMRTQQELIESQARLEEISMTDSLTDIANRRCFEKTLFSEWERSVRSTQPLSLLMLDVDFFKNINDRRGHLFGDRCLYKIAQALHAELTRSGDLLARYGGEEFVILLPATGRSGAIAVATKMQAAVNALKIENESSTGPYATISVGLAVAEFPTRETSHDLIEAADVALYQAKQRGRNRIEQYSA